MTANAPGWVPDSCTLPTAEQPLRVAEFADVFRAALRSVDRTGGTTLRLVFADAPGLLKTITGLTDRESECCSFFTFETTRTTSKVLLDVGVPAAYREVLDRFERMARSELSDAAPAGPMPT